MQKANALGSSTAALDSAGLAIVPRPAEMEPLEGHFETRPESVIRVVGGGPEASTIAEYLGGQLGLQVVGGAGAGAGPDITLGLDSGASGVGPEGYSLAVRPEGVSGMARDVSGLFHAVQTIRQLATAAGSGWRLPAVAVRDHARYGWRGMMLDCCRHFMTKDFVMRYIDLLAFHKMNVLHLHLADDQGWRLEIKRYPKLVEIGAWRKATRDSEQPRDAAGRYGGFYTQEEMREIVAYAASRCVAIVPEIEMPGHSLAALASYPELSCSGGPFSVWTEWGISEDVYCVGREGTFEFLEGVLAEVIDVFPGEFVHIGGDEVPRTRWEKCPKCQARMGTEGFKGEPELQGYLVRRIAEFLGRAGRRLIGWDEVLEGGAPRRAVVQSWRGMNGALAAATAGHDVIASPTTHCYLDYPQRATPEAPKWMGVTPLEKAYAFEPTPAELTPEQARHILGLEGNMWTERAPQERVDAMVFPRLCALAEVGWSPARGRNWPDFLARMDRHAVRLAAMGVCMEEMGGSAAEG